MYRCLIIDDEPIAIRVIRSHLASFRDFEVIAECNNALEATSVLVNQEIDLMFCDIQMPQLSGVDFVKTLIHPPKVIFTTAYRDYAVEALDLHVVDYLLKPISFERFVKAIQHFLTRETKSPTTHSQNLTTPKNRDFILLKADKKHYKVDLSDILYIESLGDYVIVYTTNKKIVSKERISHLSETLPSDRFIQIHRSYIVSVKKIESLGPGFLEINKKKLSVGRNYKAQLHKMIGSI